MNKQEGGIKDSLKSEVNAALENAAHQLIMFAALRILDLPHLEETGGCDVTQLTRASLQGNASFVS